MTAVIFGNGKCLQDSGTYKFAFEVGRLLGEKGYNIVNGGYYGVMEASAKGASSFQVERIGVVLRKGVKVPNIFLTRIIEVDTYLERLQKLVELGDIFLVFYGGSGTLLEFFALLALKERSFLQKEIICCGRKWLDFFQCLDTLCENFEKIDFLKNVKVAFKPEEILKLI
ncbi:MAG: LOG family protein [Ignavibacteria bacterium]|nr:LOG family protein [Ignavibacteria bacterium]